MRLIKKRIQQLESIQRRKTIIKLAKKCADKFEDQMDLDQADKFSSFCYKKLHSLLKSTSIPNEEENILIQNIINVYDQIFFDNTKQANTLAKHGMTLPLDETSVSNSLERKQSISSKMDVDQVKLKGGQSFFYR